jgi:hypothetical protein
VDDRAEEGEVPPAVLHPTSEEIDAVILAATTSRSTSDGRIVPLKDTRTQLFVGNVIFCLHALWNTDWNVWQLPYRVRWQDLKDLFRKAGTVLRADVALGPDNRSRGYGTVLLATAEDAGRAVDMFNGYSWQTRVLEVRLDRLPADLAAGDLPTQQPSLLPAPFPIPPHHAVAASVAAAAAAAAAAASILPQQQPPPLPSASSLAAATAAAQQIGLSTRPASNAGLSPHPPPFPSTSILEDTPSFAFNPGMPASSASGTPLLAHTPSLYPPSSHDPTAIRASVSRTLFVGNVCAPLPLHSSLFFWQTLNPSFHSTSNGRIWKTSSARPARSSAQTSRWASTADPAASEQSSMRQKPMPSVPSASSTGTSSLFLILI